MTLLKPKTKLTKYEFELDEELVKRLRSTLKNIKEKGDVELLIGQEVSRFLTKLLNKVDKELKESAKEKQPTPS